MGRGMGGGGPLTPEFPVLYKFFNVSIKGPQVVAFTAFCFFFFATTVKDRSAPEKMPEIGANSAITPKDLQ